MGYKNLYNILPGYESEYLLEQRKEHSLKVIECHRKNAQIELSKIRALCKRYPIGQIDYEQFNKIRSACASLEIGDLALRNRLETIGYDVSQLLIQCAGWPSSWPAYISSAVEDWLESKPFRRAGRWDYVELDDVVASCVSHYVKKMGDDEIVDFLTVRSLKMVLDAEGIGPIKKRGGRNALIGWSLRKKQ